MSNRSYGSTLLTRIADRLHRCNQAHYTPSQTRWPRFFSLATLLLTIQACAPGGGGAQPTWRYEVADVWGDSGAYIHVDGQRVYLAPKLPPVQDKSTLITKSPETHILTALDLTTGQRIWEQRVEIKFGTDWLTTADRVIFIAPNASEGTVSAQSIIALDGATGQPAWRFDQMQVDDSLLQQGSCIFLFDTAGRLGCLDAASGQVMGVYPGVPLEELGDIGGKGIREHITADGFYQLSPAGVLRVYKIPDATLAYSTTLEFAGRAAGLSVEADHAFLVTTPDDSEYTRQVFDLPSGSKRWEAADTSRFLRTAEFAGRRYVLFEQSESTGFVVFDLATGEKLYEVDASTEAYWVSPGGRLIVYPESGKLAAYDLATGAQLWRVDSDTDGPSIIDGQGDSVYLTGYRQSTWSVTPFYDRFEVFRVEDGALRWRLNRGVEALIPPGSSDVLLGDSGLLELYPLAP